MTKSPDPHERAKQQVTHAIDDAMQEIRDEPDQMAAFNLATWLAEYLGKAESAATLARYRAVKAIHDAGRLTLEKTGAIVGLSFARVQKMIKAAEAREGDDVWLRKLQAENRAAEEKEDRQ